MVAPRLAAVLTALLAGSVPVHGRCFMKPDENGHVKWPKRRNKITRHMFRMCTELKSISLPAEVDFVDNTAFLNSGLNLVELTTVWREKAEERDTRILALEERIAALQKWAPSTCADIQSRDPSSEDGEYTITRKTDGVSRDINVYCHNMDSVPKEFLTLTELNYSQFKAGGARKGQTVVTTFTKIRLDIATLKADINDHTFSTSVGKINDVKVKDYMPFGLAYSCISADKAYGKAEINLSGTPFKVISKFEVWGYKSAGGAVYNSASNLWNISGGGYCGWCIPKSGVWDPYKFKPEEEWFSLWLDFMCGGGIHGMGGAPPALCWTP